MPLQSDNPDLPEFSSYQRTPEKHSIKGTTPLPKTSANNISQTTSASSAQTTTIVQPHMQSAYSQATNRIIPSNEFKTSAEASQKLIALKEKEKKICEEINRLNEAERRESEYRIAKPEIETLLIRGITILKEEIIRSKREYLLQSETLSSFEEHLDRVKKLNLQPRTENALNQDYVDKLTQALALLDRARSEWNSALVKIPALQPESKSDSDSISKLSFFHNLLTNLDNLAWKQIIKIGLIINWPILLVALISFFIAVILIFK